jgi:predicted ATPase/DNA-binding NarL/FixJ family response regulator/DNA-binding XRE family transcriptional regulator
VLGRQGDAGMVAEEPALTFAGLLRQLRSEARLTQEELAEAASLSPRSISDLERGINHTARRDTALLLAGALGLDGQARELFVAAARGRSPARMRYATRAPRRDLPAPADLFVGREGELADLSRMLAGAWTRLVTLTGPPGIGKTRLAIACAAAYAERTGCVAVFVDLAPLRDPALVMVELARALDVEPRTGTDLIGQLASTVGNEDRLLVLDNWEHLLAAAPDLGLVLATCQRLLVLATSRERLRLSAEQEFPVPPLAMPAPADAADLDLLGANPSVVLLVDRARRINPGFALTAANAPLLASACVRLEGVPLAIELAAARLKVLTPGELVFRLGSRMEVLAGSARDVPARQRALRNAIAWSYDLLNVGERALFRELSVFVGSWTLADADDVCSGATGDLFAVVESLLDKSLIRRLPGDEETAEFAMLESLREYAAHQLTSHGETGEMRARHVSHYAGLAAEFDASVGLPEERRWMLRLGRHHANMRAALDYCLETGQDTRALMLAAALGWYHHTRGDLGQGQAVLDRVLSADVWQRDPPDADGPAATGALPSALVVGGVLAWGTGQLSLAKDLLLQAFERCEQRGDLRRAAIACAFLGHVARARGQWEASASWHRRAAAGFGQGGNTQGVAWAQHDLGLLARDRGDLRAAAALFRASLRDFRELDYPWAVAWSAWGLGTVLIAGGEVDEACPLLAEALQIYREFNDPRGIAQCLEALAQIAGELAHHETAARLIGSAAAMRARLAAPPPDAEQVRTSALERALARSLGPEAAERLRQQGRAMSAQQAAELGMAVAMGDAPADPDRYRPVSLTHRERQVAALVASGRTNRQIGRMLGISEKTTEVHLHHVMSKLEARSRAEVAAWAVTHHLSAPAGT